MQEEFGKRKAQRAIAEVLEKDSGDIKDKLIEKAFEFYGDFPRKDDITLVVLKIPEDAKFNRPGLEQAGT